MKKTYSARRNALFTLSELSWGARGLLFVLVLLVVRFATPNFFWQIASPLFRVADAIASANHYFLGSFGDAARVAMENDALRNMNETLVTENAALTQKVAALSLLATGTAQSKSAATILADVVARPPVSPYDTLVLAQGARAGVVLGMEAFGASGAPLGIVTHVTQDFSRVLLFSSAGVRTSGWVGRESTPVSVLGGGGGTLSVVLSRSANIAVGDTVHVPGPGMLPIGIVARVDDDPSSPAVTLRIRPLSNPFSVGTVSLRVTGVQSAANLSAATSTPQ